MQTLENHQHFAKLSDRILRDIWEFDPVGATIRGIHHHDHTLGDVSAYAYRHHARKLREYISALQSEIDPELLSPEERIDYHALLSHASSHFITLECQRPWMRDPGMYPSIGIWGCFSLLVYEFAPLEDRMRSMLDRMREIPDMLEVSKSNLSETPRVFVETAIQVIRHIHPFFRDTVPSLAEQFPALRDDLLKAGQTAAGAFEDYEKWLTKTVLPTAQGDFAVGRDVYEQLLFATHYLTYSPEDLVRLAMNVLNDTLASIREVAAEIDPSVTWQELVSRLKTEHPTEDDLVEAYRSAANAAKEFVLEHDLVTVPTDGDLTVRDTPTFERCLMPYAAYFPPAPFDNCKAGAIWVTPVDEDASEEQRKAQLLGHCSYTIPIIALHEGYPGHHLQLTRACSLNSAVRKQMSSSLLIEGWALYCEEMMHEQGFYTDPRIRLFQLKGLLWRACRVIIDVGLHTGQMTFEEAVDMLVNTAHLEDVNALAEVKRYTMTPTQPMTYVIGKLLLLDLRERMKRTMGNRFDLKTFHDQVLNHGSIPPSLIAEEMMRQPHSAPAESKSQRRTRMAS